MGYPFGKIAVALSFGLLGLKAPTTIRPRAASSFEQVLVSTKPSPQMPKGAADIFNWLIGDWQADVYDYRADGTRSVNKGEWHFSWVLEGRAIQDVWIVPPVSLRDPSTSKENNRYGTTLRIYDPEIGAWRVFWFNPVTQDRSQLVARRVGGTIVQQGIDDDGSFVRWTFQDIKADTFVWRGEFSRDGGRTWRLDAEFIACRIRE
jgi:hypothetical protein